MFGQQGKSRRRVLGLVGLMSVGPAVTMWSATALQAASCDPVPYLAQGASTTVGAVTVTATVNTANSVGGQPNYYLHQSPPASTNPALDTTWTFSPPISEIRFQTINHADSFSEPENYFFTAKDGSGNTVGTFNIENADGTFGFGFATPVSSIAATYTPTTGVFGSFLLLNLPSAPGACGPVEPVEAAPDSETPQVHISPEYLERRTQLPSTR